MEMLANKVIRGTLWIAASYIITSILYFLRTIILVRLLSPIDFGLMGIVRVALNMLERFTETGIGAALVQKKEVGESTLNTTWVITAIRGAILFIALYVFAMPIARFYNNEHLSPILKFVSFSFLFSGITSVSVFLFVKELNFKNKIILEQANAISATVVSVILAIIFRNVWALAIGYLVGTIVGFIFSYILHPFRPSFKFDLNAAKGLFDFGKYIFAAGIVVFLAMQGPDALVGKILGLNSLGFYVIAFNIANMPATSVTHLTSQIAFPVYAKLQDDLPKLREGYLKIIRLITFLSAPLAGGIFMLIPEFIQIFLGVRWTPIILPVRILCVMGFVRSICSTAGPVFYGVGRPDIDFKLACFNTVLLGIFIFPFTVRMGIIGTAIAFSLASIIAVFIIMRLVYKLIKLDAEKAQFFKILIFPLIGTILMCFSILPFKSLFSHSLIMVFSLSVLTGAISYIATIYVLDKYFGYGLTETVRFAFDSFKRKP